MNTNLNELTLTQLFDFKTKKDQNGEINKLREIKFVEEINLKNKSQDNIIKTILSKLKEYDLDFDKCEHIGGCGNSHDFEFICGDKKFNVELKVSASNFVPQLADIYLKDTNTEIIKEQFNNFITGWIDKLKNIKDEFKMNSNVDESIIKSTICSIPIKGKSKCEFLDELKKIVKKNSELRSKLEIHAKKYINDFLQNNHENNIIKDNILKLYQKKLGCKDFIIKYNQSNKKLELIKNDPIKLEIEDVSLQKSKDGELNVGYNIKFNVTENEHTENKNVSIRLRYKNGTGVYGISWQLGFLYL